MASRLNWLRAGVLGANDGIVSTAGIVVGVAGATTEPQRDPDRRHRRPRRRRDEHGRRRVRLGQHPARHRAGAARQGAAGAAETPDEELAELTEIYAAKGLSAELAREVAEQLTAHDALGAHAEAELGIDPDELTNPWHAALASLVAVHRRRPAAAARDRPAARRAAGRR